MIPFPKPYVCLLFPCVTSRKCELNMKKNAAKVAREIYNLCEVPSLQKKKKKSWYAYEFSYSTQPANPNLCETISHFA